MTLLAVHVPALIAVCAVLLAVVVLALIVFAPWKSVREEPPLDDDIETRLLLGEDPATVADDADAADAHRLAPHDLERERERDDADR